METYYSDMSLPDRISDNSIFLAGPTPRSEDIKSWRIDAVSILDELGYDGELYIPERKTGWAGVDYTEQVEWEHDALNNVGIIVFWVPRDIAGGMPGFTTNVEFGMYVTDMDCDVLYGRPPKADKIRYLDLLYLDVRDGEAIYDDLEPLLSVAVEKLSK